MTMMIVSVSAKPYWAEPAPKPSLGGMTTRTGDPTLAPSRALYRPGVMSFVTVASVALSSVQVALPGLLWVPSAPVPPGHTTGLPPRDVGQVQPLYLMWTVSFFLIAGPDPAL